MAMRFLTEFNIGNTADVGQYRARIYYDNEWGEYRVRFYHHATYRGADEDYHTDDRADANNTAIMCLRTLQRNHKD